LTLDEESIIDVEINKKELSISKNNDAYKKPNKQKECITCGAKHSRMGYYCKECDYKRFNTKVPTIKQGEGRTSVNNDNKQTKPPDSCCRCKHKFGFFQSGEYYDGNYYCSSCLIQYRHKIFKDLCDKLYNDINIPHNALELSYKSKRTIVPT